MEKDSGIVKQKIEKFEFILIGGNYTPPKWQEIEKAIKSTSGEFSIRDKIIIEYLGTAYKNGDWEYHVKVVVEKNRSKLLVGHPINYSIIADNDSEVKL